MQKQIFIVGNWKMNLSFQEGINLVSGINNFLVASYKKHSDNLQTPKILACPPSVYIAKIVDVLRRDYDYNYKDDYDLLHIGAQDCHYEKCGAYTGDVSADMLAEIGAKYVIIGHSERRQYHAETNGIIRKKALAAKQAGLIPIICVGETLQQYQANQTEIVLQQQVKQSLPPEFCKDDFILAYEPVWAIGTGKIPQVEEISATHKFLAKQIPAGSAILYGGSVKPDNACDILALQDVHGVLVGGASLKVDSFNGIISAAVDVLRNCGE